MADSRAGSGIDRVLDGVLLAVALATLTAADWCVGGGVIFSALLAGLVALGLAEFYTLARGAGAEPLRRFGIACGAVLVAAQWAHDFAADRLPFADATWGLDLLAAVVAAALFGIVGAHVVRSGIRGAWPNLGATVLGLALVWFPTVFIVWIRGFGLGPLALLVGTVKVSDMAAYAVGRAVGRRRLAPVVSPNKTVAGAVAAVLAGTLAAVAFCAAWPQACAGLGLLAGAIFGLIVTVFGMLGDLGESVLKRAAGAKDASGLLRGFGGVLDVLDSVWGAAPAAYVAFVLLGTPAAGLVVL